MPVLISSTESSREDERVSPAQMSGAAESSEVAQKFNPTHEASQSAHKNSSGMRVMRTSPVTLISCGLVFVSLIFLLNFMAQRGARAEQSAGNQAASNNQEKNSTASVASVQQPRPQTNVTVPQPKPSVETASIVPAVEAAPVAPKVENEKPQPTPTPAPTPAEKQAIKVEPPPAAAPAGEDGFTLQVGSYNELSQAQERAAKLGSVGVNAYVARVEIPKRGTWYRVQTGRFSNREEAVRYGTQLRSKGMVADFIVAPSKAS